MTVNVFFFGATADTIGSRELELATAETTTAQALIDQLTQQRPALANHKLLIAINEEYADADTLLNDGDELALFTAVSGG